MSFEINALEFLERYVSKLDVQRYPYNIKNEAKKYWKIINRKKCAVVFFLVKFILCKITIN